MLPDLQVVSSWRCRCQLPTTAFGASILLARRALVLSFGLTLNRWRGTNAFFWNSLFGGFFGGAGLS